MSVHLLKILQMLYKEFWAAYLHQAQLLVEVVIYVVSDFFLPAFIYKLTYGILAYNLSIFCLLGILNTICFLAISKMFVHLLRL